MSPSTLVALSMRSDAVMAEKEGIRFNDGRSPVATYVFSAVAFDLRMLGYVYSLHRLEKMMELQSVRSQLAAEQSRCFKLEVEVAEIRQKIKAMETLEKELELLHRQRAVASEQAAANMNGKRQSSGCLLELFRQKHGSPMKVSGSGQRYSRTAEINNAFANEVSWDRSSTSSTQAPTQRQEHMV